MSVQEKEPRDTLGIRIASCTFCGNRLDPDDPFIHREVTSWVHGPKLDHPVLRQQTGRLAHSACVDKVINGVDPSTEPLFEL